MPPDLEVKLARAEVLINEGEQRIRRQRDLVAQLGRLRTDTTLAEQLLANFEAAQQVQLAKREQLLSQSHRRFSRA